MRITVVLVTLVLVLAACDAERTPPPLAATEDATGAAPPPAPTAPPLAPTLSPSAQAPASAPPVDPTAAAVVTYRAWMEEARLLHPYDEPVDKMWAVMLCESSGDAAVVAGGYYGLFQYSAETWGGAWNPYRDRPILDPRAQIFATAKAWQDGYQSWWGCA